MKRPFRGLRRRPDERYDVVIVGAGIGGLVCANLLARGGLRVLLVEQHYMVGGFCSTFRRAGYTFDAATHFYPLLGNPETMTGRLLVELGVETEWIKMDPVDTFHFPDGCHFDVPADFPTYRAALDREFPHEREGLDRFFRRARLAYRLGLIAHFRLRPARGIEAIESRTVWQEITECVQDPKLRLLLTADCPHWGSPPERTSFVFDSMLRLSYFLGNYYPAMGSQAFADDLALRFELAGGHLLTSTEVERIRVTAGRVTGVDLRTIRGPAKGTARVEANRVVSNADWTLTLQHLLREVPEAQAWHRSFSDLRLTYPCCLTHIGLRGVDPDRLREAQGYYWRTWDPNDLGGRALRAKIFVPTAYEPRMAPAGGQAVILQKVYDIDFEAVEDWRAHRLEMENSLFEHLRSVVPEVEGRVVTMTTATARTSQHFTANRRGAMLGWEISPEQLGEGRPDIEGPIEGLLLVGHWVRPGGGITPVIVGAQQVAERVLGAS